MTRDEHLPDRPAPHAPDMEDGVLGSMLWETPAIEEARAILEAGDFYSEQNRLIYQAIIETGKADALLVECKYRSAIAVVRWLEQAEGYADGTGKIPVVFARERGDSRPIAILRFEDFLEMTLETRQ